MPVIRMADGSLVTVPEEASPELRARIKEKNDAIKLDQAMHRQGFQKPEGDEFLRRQPGVMGALRATPAVRAAQTPQALAPLATVGGTLGLVKAAPTIGRLALHPATDALVGGVQGYRKGGVLGGLTGAVGGAAVGSIAGNLGRLATKTAPKARAISHDLLQHLVKTPEELAQLQQLARVAEIEAQAAHPAARVMGMRSAGRGYPP